LAARNTASVESRVWTHEGLVRSQSGGERDVKADCSGAPSTLQHRGQSGGHKVHFSPELTSAAGDFVSSLGWTAICGRRPWPLRKNIIGHGMVPVFRGRLASGCALRHVRAALPLLNQPPRQQGHCSFVHPLIEQRRDLLSEIGGLTEPGELKALQRRARGREQEVPRWLGARRDQGSLLRVDRRR